MVSHGISCYFMLFQCILCYVMVFPGFFRAMIRSGPMKSTNAWLPRSQSQPEVLMGKSTINGWFVPFHNVVPHRYVCYNYLHIQIPVWGSWLKTWSWSQSFLAKMPRNFSLQNLGHSVFNFWSLFIYFKNLILNKPCTHWISSQGTPFGNILAIGWTQTN